MVKISAVILTKNEERNIERCIKSVLPVSDEVIVMDCFSSDNTVEIAKKLTNKVYQNEWPGYSEQRKLAISKTTNDWILWVDADEEVSSGLENRIKSLDFEADGYLIPILVNYLGQWIQHSGWYPGYKIRLFNKTKGQFNDVAVHETFNLYGRTEKLKEPLYHYSYRDIAHHIEKMNVYTDLAAVQMKEKGKKPMLMSVLAHSLFSFFRTYVLKLGFLDGRAGLIVSILGSYYVFLKYIKLWETNNVKSNGNGIF